MRHVYTLVMVLGIGLSGCSPRNDNACYEDAEWEVSAVQMGDVRDGVEALAQAEVSSPERTVPAIGSAAGSEQPPQAADNFYCFVCHMNYDGEELALNHELAGVGCATCHGVSDRHSADEDGITPPEKMFSRDEVDAYCMTCHAEADIKDSASHKPVFGQAVEKERLCTDCHGKHRLAVRTRRWDKETGKLISDDGVRMMYEDSPTRVHR